MICSVLTHFTEGEGALVPSADLTGSTSREVKELDQSWDHFILLLSVTQTAVTSEAPAEHPLLGVQHQLHITRRSGFSYRTDHHHHHYRIEENRIIIELTSEYILEIK